MRLLRWFLRRDLLMADSALVGGIAAASIGLVGGIVAGEDAPAAGSLRILGVFAIVYGVVWILLYAALSSETAQSDRWATTQAVKRLADAAVGMVLFIGLQIDQPTFGPRSEPRLVFGVPVSYLVFLAGAAVIAIGWIWIRLIARGEPEPEANDRFWWSRA